MSVDSSEPGHFADGTTEWAVVTFDRESTFEHRNGFLITVSSEGTLPAGGSE